MDTTHVNMDGPIAIDPHFLDDKPRPTPDQHPDGAGHFVVAKGKNTGGKMIDPYLNDGAEEPFDRDGNIINLRLWDEEGEDTAYDLGLSPVRKPAPAGRRPLTSPPSDFLP